MTEARPVFIRAVRNPFLTDKLFDFNPNIQLIKPMQSTLTIFGSGSGDASADRNSAGYCLTLDNRHYIFDCGSGATTSFLKAGFDPLAISAIFISHMHPDHHSDLALLIQKIYLAGRKDPLIIYMPSEAVVPYKQFLTASYLIFEKLPFRIELKPVEESVALFDNKLIITAIPNNHLSKYESYIEKYKLPNRMQSFSFQIAIENKIIFYSADLESIDDIKKYLENLDLLIIETTHVDLAELQKSINNVNKIILSHITDDHLGAIRDFVTAANSDTEYIVARDNLMIKL